MSLTVVGYLDKTGAIAILSVLDHQELRFTDIQDEVMVSPSTLSNRLEEGRELDLISGSVMDANEGTKKVYHLTTAGEEVYRKMSELGIPQAYTKMIAFQEQVEEETEALQEWVEENEQTIHMQMDAGGEDIPSDRHPD